MKPPKDENNNNGDRLINDENFLDVIEGEYNRAGKPVDELAKKRVWQLLEKESAKVGADAGTGNQKVTGSAKSSLARRFQMLTLLAASLCAVFLSVRFFERPIDSAQRIKGKLGAIEFVIGMYEQKPDGDLVPFGVDSKRVPGMIILPFVRTETEAVVLLVKKTGVDQYDAVSDAEMASGGEEHYFSQGGETMAVEIEKEAETYCAVIAESMNVMGGVVSSLPVIVKLPNTVMECFSL